MEKKMWLVWFITVLLRFPFGGVPSKKGPRGFKMIATLFIWWWPLPHLTSLGKAWRVPVAPRHLEPPIWLAVKVGFQVWQSVFAELANNFSEFPVMPNVFFRKNTFWQTKMAMEISPVSSRQGICCASGYESILGCVCVVSSRLKMEVGWEDHLVGYRHVRLDWSHQLLTWVFFLWGMRRIIRCSHPHFSKSKTGIR